MSGWLANNWYLIIPWVLAIGAWIVARRRRVRRPLVPGVVGFLVGSVIVLALDLFMA